MSVRRLACGILVLVLEELDLWLLLLLGEDLEEEDLVGRLVEEGWDGRSP